LESPLSNDYTGKEVLASFFGTISGKINKENIASVVKTGTKNIDISSGLENEMGEISVEKINSLFKYLHNNKLLHQQ
jgi:phosphoribosylanthranilate isomerase